jgi:hypothetical protein
MVPVKLDVVAAEGTALGRLDARGGAAEGAQKRAVFADCIDRNVTHTVGMSESVAG